MLHVERMKPRDAGRGKARTSNAAGALVPESVFAVLGVWFHYGMTAEYGDVTELAEGRRAGASSVLEFGGLALLLVVVAALIVLFLATQRWARLAAVAIPVLMVGAILLITPAALQQKLESQFSDTPQCGVADFEGPGPGADAARESQLAFESIEHVGHFHGGGGSGVGGCDRPFVLIEDLGVLPHYRAALSDAGWHVVEDDTRRLRAERDGMAFEVIVCRRGGVVWAGNADVSGGARCPTEY